MGHSLASVRELLRQWISDAKALQAQRNARDESARLLAISITQAQLALGALLLADEAEG